MTRKRINFLEERAEVNTGRKKVRDFKRTPKDGRYSEVEGLLGVADIEEAPPARVLHLVARLPGKEGISHTDPVPEMTSEKPPEVEEEKEIKLPKNFFEKTLASAIGSTYRMVKSGLEIIRKIKFENKDLEIVKDRDRSKINFEFIEKIKLVDPDKEKLLSEMKRLNDFNAEEYNIVNLQKKIDSYPIIIALKNSNKPDDEKQKEYKKLLGIIIGHEVRDIFRHNKEGETGQSMETAIAANAVVHEGLMQIVDREEKGADGSAPQENVLAGTEAEKDGENRVEKLVKLEEKIEKEFSPVEKEFVEWIKENYPNHLQAAKVKMDNKGATINVSAVRQSYIDERIRWGLDKSKWGSNQQLAPEKAQLLGKYLELKLPHRLPPEKPAENPEVVGSGNEEETKKELYSKEQVEELSDMVKVAREYMEQIERSELEKIIGQLILEESVSEGIFTKEQIPNAVQWVMEWVDIFSIKK